VASEVLVGTRLGKGATYMAMGACTGELRLGGVVAVLVDGDVSPLSRSVQLLCRSVGGAGESGNKPGVHIEVDMLTVRYIVEPERSGKTSLSTLPSPLGPGLPGFILRLTGEHDRCQALQYTWLFLQYSTCYFRNSYMLKYFEPAHQLPTSPPTARQPPSAPSSTPPHS
jgi:hypothetical protein